MKDEDQDAATQEATKVENMQGFGSTNSVVAHTSPDTLKHHFHARGRPASPFYTISQPQSAAMAPLGLISFGLTTILLQGANTTITEGGTAALTYCFALGFGGIVQLLAGMWEASRGKVFGAVVFSLYGGFWISFGLYGILVSGGVLLNPAGSAPGPIPDGLQMMLSLWGILTFLLFLCALALNIALQLLLFMLTITFFLLAAGEKHHTVQKAAGWFGVITGGIAMYIGFAELFNAVNEYDIMPLGPMNWIALLMPKHTRSDKYSVQKVEPRTFAGGQRGEGEPIGAPGYNHNDNNNVRERRLPGQAEHRV